MKILEVLKRPEYDFVHEQERLGNRIDFLCFGGSVSYGLNGPNSDIDIRGVCSPLKRDIFGGNMFKHPDDSQNTNINIQNGRFEQYLDKETDTCIYNINKYVSLIYACNPNTIEMLGCLPEHYAYISKSGQLLLDNAGLFITKKAYDSFGGYAKQQFVRLQNSLVKRVTRLEQLMQTISVIERTYEHLEEAFPTFKREMLEFYIIDSRDEKIDMKKTDMFFNSFVIDKEKLSRDLSEADLSNAQLRINLKMDGISPEDLKGVVSETSNIINNFSSHTGHRNNKKDEKHEDKHASHLRRLQITCRKIFEQGKICTYCREDIEELLDIKRGKYRMPDGSYDPAFFDMINREMEEIKKLYEKSTLPEEPDISKVFDLLMQINEEAVLR